MRLIDANALREKAQWMEMPDNQGINFDVRAVSVSSIELAPTIDAEPVRHGRWIWRGNDKGWFCSECESGCLLNMESDWHKSDWCPHCGCKMDLE